MFVKTGLGPFQNYQVGLTVSGQIHELCTGGQSEVWFHSNRFECGKPNLNLFPVIFGLNRDRAEIALVEPCVDLFCQDAGYALAMEVGPPPCRAIQSCRQILQARRIHLFHGVLHLRFRILELERREAAFQIAAIIELVAALRNFAEECVYGIASVSWLLLVRVGKVRRAHQAVLADPWLIGEVVKHQDTLAEPCGANFEGGTIGRKGIGSEIPVTCVIRLRHIGVVLAVVEDHLEHPAGILDLCLCQEDRASSLIVKQRSFISVADML